MGDKIYKKVDLEVESAPIFVHFECPFCEEDIAINYGDFCCDIGEPCDWGYSKFDCPECKKGIEINSTYWD